jgi:hypothetical protein
MTKPDDDAKDCSSDFDCILYPAYCVCGACDVCHVCVICPSCEDVMIETEKNDVLPIWNATYILMMMTMTAKVMSFAIHSMNTTRISSETAHVVAVVVRVCALSYYCCVCNVVLW